MFYIEQLNNKKTIVIKQDKIIWIGDSSSFERENTDTFLSISDYSLVLPGLIDCHVHLESQPVVNYEQEAMRTKTATYSYYAFKNALLHLTAGFTTVRDCGGKTHGSSLRELFESGYLPGPRLLVAHRPITQFGNQEFVGPDELYEKKSAPETLSGKDGVIHAVRDRIKSGSDFIKVMTSGGVLHG